MKLKKILFFIAAAVPTEKELEAAAKLGTRMFRNASAVDPEAGVETCDYVAGCVPESYAKRFPVVKDSIPDQAPAAPVIPESAPVATDENAAPPDAPIVTEASTKAEIQEALTARGISFPSGATKAELLALLPA